MILENEVFSTIFLGLIWLVEKGGSLLGVSPVISNILVGIVMGPALINKVPYVEAVKLVGKLGVMMLVIEAGLGFELDQLKKIGIRAFFMAATGVVFPVVLMLVTYQFIFDVNIEGTLSLGAALAPTSLGFSAKLLKDANILQTDDGILICAAAVIDDVLSLVLLGEVLGLADPTAENMIMPIVGALVTGIVGFLLAIIMGYVLPNPEQQTSEEDGSAPEQAPAEEGGFLSSQAFGAYLLFGFGLLVGMMGAALKSSDLIGCFVVGVAFSSYKPVTEFWEKQVKKICLWMTRLFFAGTIALTVPELEGQFFTGKVFLRAAVLAVCGLLGKMTVGLYATPLKCNTFNFLGWGMGGRGEFSFLIAKEAYEEGIFSETDYCAVIWALLVISAMAPFGMKFFLKRMKAEDCASGEKDLKKALLVTPSSPSGDPEAKVSNEVETEVEPEVEVAPEVVDGQEAAAEETAAGPTAPVGEAE